MKKKFIMFSKYLMCFVFVLPLLIVTSISQSLNYPVDENFDQVSDDVFHTYLIFDYNNLLNPKDTGDVVHSIPTPWSNTQGLTWDGNYLWASDVISGMIYKLDPVNGTVLSSFDAPGISVEGLGWDGTNLWAVDNNSGPNEGTHLYKLNPDDGSVITLYEPDGTVWIHGITWDGQYIHMIDFSEHLIYKFDPVTGSVLSSIPAPGEKCIGLTWDGNHLWTDDFETDLLYCLNPEDGAILYHVNSPHTNPRDLAWDGQYLWVLAFQVSTIYQVDVAGTTIIDDFKPNQDCLDKLVVYPNPVQNKMNLAFQLKNTQEVEIMIFDQGGRLVYFVEKPGLTTGQNSINIGQSDLSLLTPGVYICQLTAGDQIATTKFVVIK